MEVVLKVLMVQLFAVLWVLILKVSPVYFMEER